MQNSYDDWLTEQLEAERSRHAPKEAQEDAEALDAAIEKAKNEIARALEKHPKLIAVAIN